MRVITTTGDIVLRSECDPDASPNFCDKVWSRMCEVQILTYRDKPKRSVDDLDSVGTRSMGCGNSFKGGRCSDGSDTLECVYERISDPGADKCIGLSHLVKIPESNECKD